MLILTLSLSLTAFSQTDTSTKVKCLPVTTFKKIAQDLLRGDSAMAELKLVNEQLIKTEEKVALKDSIISTMQIKEQNYMSIIDAQNQKYAVLEGYTKKLEFQLKKEKVKGKFKTILGGGMVAVLGVLLLIH